MIRARTGFLSACPGLFAFFTVFLPKNAFEFHKIVLEYGVRTNKGTNGYKGV